MFKTLLLNPHLTYKNSNHVYNSYKSVTRRAIFTMYDVAVIGGGPAGYVTAIRAAQQGLKTVCIEKRGTLGGTCLNVGCIPSKILLNTTHKYHDAQHNFNQLGIKGGSYSVDMEAVQKNKENIMKSLMTGIEGLFKLNKIDYQVGEASLKTVSSISVTDSKGETKTIDTKNIVIATGSTTSSLPNMNVVPDEELILTSTGALNLKKIPKSMIVIGAGVIGLELGSVYNRLGTSITVVEFLDRIAPAFDNEVATAFQKILTKQGFQFKLSNKVTDISIKEGTPKHVEVTVQNAKTQKTEILKSDKVLIAVGRKPFTDNLKLQELNIETDKIGRIIVNDDFTVKNYSNIYAIGDVIKGPMLAHKAEDEGVAVADKISGKQFHINYNSMPSVVYTHPEVAGVGKTEDELKNDKIKYKKGTFPFAANSRARVNSDTDGFVKILTEESTDKILGAWIIGPSAGELIQELVLGIEYGASSEDIARTCHGHPTLSEAIKEASLSAHRKAIHFK